MLTQDTTIPLLPAYQGEAFQNEDRATSPANSVATRITGFSGAPRLQSFRHAATSAVSLLVGANSLRRTVLIKNEGSNDVFIGGEDVTINNGYRLGTTDALTLEVSGEIYVVTASTSETLYCLTEMDG